MKRRTGHLLLIRANRYYMFSSVKFKFPTKPLSDKIIGWKVPDRNVRKEI